MPLYDYECKCGTVTEAIAGVNEDTLPCRQCGKGAARIISASGQFTGNEDAPWIRSVLDVVDKKNPAQHVQEFVKNPTRSNYHRWMKGEKIVPVDYTVRGGPPTYERPPEPDRQKAVERMMRTLQSMR